MNDSNSLQYLVSNIDIINKLKNFTVKILLYKELKNIRDISELLPTQYCAVCILIKILVIGHVLLDRIILYIILIPMVSK